MSFKPRILGFLCNWCSYAAADLAGVSRIQYPPNIRILRVMCSGRVDPVFIFEGLEKGIDGIIIMGCHPGDCHYLSGNYEAEVKYKFLKKLLNIINFSDRLNLEWVSASEGTRFADVVINFTEHIKALGPSPFSKENIDQKLLLDFEALKRVAGEQRLRVLVGRERKLIEEGNVYNKKLSSEELESVIDNAIYNEYIRQKILILLQDQALSVKILAEQLNIDSSEILGHIINLKAKGLVDFERWDEITPYYISIMEGR